MTPRASRPSGREKPRSPGRAARRRTKSRSRGRLAEGIEGDVLQCSHSGRGAVMASVGKFSRASDFDCPGCDGAARASSPAVRPAGVPFSATPETTGSGEVWRESQRAERRRAEQIHAPARRGRLFISYGQRPSRRLADDLMRSKANLLVRIQPAGLELFVRPAPARELPDRREPGRRWLPRGLRRPRRGAPRRSSRRRLPDRTSIRCRALRSR